MRKAERGRRNAEGGTREAERGRRNAEGGTRKAEGGRRNGEGSAWNELKRQRMVAMGFGMNSQGR